jgi:5-methylcytosine-specific restriction endonuclease McrA
VNDAIRVCATCGETKPVGEFHRDKRSPGGRRAQCKPCRSVKMKTWYAANAERQAGRMADRRAADLEKYRQQDRERYARHHDHRLDLAIDQAHFRRVAIAGGIVDRTVTRDNLRKQYGDECIYCRRVMDFTHGPHGYPDVNLATIEHVVPVSRAGDHTWENVVLACWGCNSDKKDRGFDEWNIA